MTTVISGSTGVNNVAASTIQQADLASNVVGNGPAFSAYNNATQSLTNSVWTKVNLQVEEYDTNSNFDTTTSRFTPTVAGYYQFNASAYVSTAAIAEVGIYKNGSLYKYGTYIAVAQATVSVFSTTVYLNGTTDYVELWVQAVGTTPTIPTSAPGTYLQGVLVRASDILLDGGIPVTSNTVYVEEPPTGFKNYIINGGCQVAQRGNVAAVSGTFVYGGADRTAIIIGGTTSSGTIQRYSGVSTSTGYAQGVLATTTGAGQLSFQHRIEAVNTIGLNGKTITVSALVYQNTGSAQTVQIVVNKPTTTVDTFSAYTALSISGGISIPSGVVTPISWTYTLGATEASLGLAPTIYFSNIGAVTAKDFWIGDYQLEKGPNPTRFDFRPYHVELAACQRYCLVIPTNTFYGTGTLRTSGTASYIFASTPVPMRVAPTESGSAAVYSGDTPAAISAFLNVGLSGSGLSMNVTHTSAGTIGQSSMIYANGAPNIFSAEL